MFSAKELITALNEKDLRAFPQRVDSKRVSISFAGSDGNRYFLTRVSIGLEDDGTPKYQWARGVQMRPQAEVNAEKNGKNTEPGDDNL